MSISSNARLQRCAVAAFVLAACPLASMTAQPPDSGAPERGGQRGELLYATHCIACHDQQIHWRDRKSARDWPTLRAEVDRWQQAGQLGWDGQDIDAVTHHLNDTIYRFAAPHTQARR